MNVKLLAACMLCVLASAPSLARAANGYYESNSYSSSYQPSVNSYSSSYSSSYQPPVPVPASNSYSSYSASSQTQTEVLYAPQVIELFPNTCVSRGLPGAVKTEGIYAGLSVLETYCRCATGSYGYTCAENFFNPCPGGGQYYPADASLGPNYFIECSWGTPYLFRCPAILVWNQNILTCDYPPAYGGNSYNNNYNSNNYNSNNYNSNYNSNNYQSNSYPSPPPPPPPPQPQPSYSSYSSSSYSSSGGQPSLRVEHFRVPLPEVAAPIVPSMSEAAVSSSYSSYSSSIQQQQPLLPMEHFKVPLPEAAPSESSFSSFSSSSIQQQQPLSIEHFKLPMFLPESNSAAPSPRSRIPKAVFIPQQPFAPSASSINAKTVADEPIIQSY